VSDIHFQDAVALENEGSGNAARGANDGLAGPCLLKSQKAAITTVIAA
jgi:hypothetical protein